MPQARIYGIAKRDPVETPFSFAETYGDKAHPHPLYGEHFAVSDVPAGTLRGGHRDRREEGVPAGDGRGGEADLGGVQAVVVRASCERLACHPERSEGSLNGRPFKSLCHVLTTIPHCVRDDITLPMFIELTDHLRCPADHDESFLVLLPDRMEGRSVRTGHLGCPVCGRTFAADGRRAGHRGRACSGGESTTVLDAEALTALVGLHGPGGYLALVGPRGRALERVAELNPGVALVAVNPPDDGRPIPPELSVLRRAGCRSSPARCAAWCWDGRSRTIRTGSGEAARVVLPGCGWWAKGRIRRRIWSICWPARRSLGWDREALNGKLTTEDTEDCTESDEPRLHACYRILSRAHLRSGPQLEDLSTRSYERCSAPAPQHRRASPA